MKESIEKNILENKGKIKITELKLQALIKILTKEGIVTTEEIETELNSMFEKKD